MKTLSSIGILLLALALAGCKQVTAPLPAWAPNAQVAAAGYAISAANAAVVKYEADVAAGFVPSPILRSVMSDMQQALATGQPIFDQWEANARVAAQAASAVATANGATPTAAASAAEAAATAVPEPAALPAQITRLTSDLSKLPSTAGAQ